MRLDPSSGGRKSVGAYYTPAPVARALCRWALRPGDRRALDPAAGEGAFVLAAADRLRTLGASADGAIGIELRPDAVARARAHLEEARLGQAELRVADFLSLRGADLPAVDAIVGNPPYVRVQRLPQEQRRRAAEAAAAAGVRLDPLASSWAAFVPHASTFLRPGGRLALVLPSELGHARYARGVLAFLRQRFARVTFVLFGGSLFPRLDQGALVLLADGYGAPFEGFEGARPASIDAFSDGFASLPRRPLDADALVGGRAYLHHAWLPGPVAAALDAVGRTPRSSRLGEHARVSIGYVTGHNGFFHLSPTEAAAEGLEPRHLRRAVFRGNALTGARFDADDWRAAAARGDAGWLLDPSDPDDPAVAGYLRRGEAAGVLRRRKVARRTPWYRVTRTQPPDLLLTAMAGVRPRLAVADTDVAVSNTLHGVWRHVAVPAAPPEALALAALTSLAALSAELEGHALGGGLLKLEPSEALRWTLPCPPPGAAPGGGPDRARIGERLARADAALRAGEPEVATALADELLLRGWSALDEVGPEGLAAAARELRQLRTGRPA